MVDLELVRRIPRYAGLGAEAQQWIAERLILRRYAAGDVLFHEGDDCAHFFLIFRGAIKVVKILESGREIIMGIFRDTEAVGEVALIDGEGYPATAIAQENADILLLPRTDYMAFLERFREAPLCIIRDLSLRMRILNGRIHDLGGGGVEYRLARILLAMGSLSEKQPGPDVRIPVRLSRQDLADLVGARIETVIRVISRWQKQDWVRTEDQMICLLDLEALEQVTYTP